MTPNDGSFTFRIRFNFPLTNRIETEDEVWLLAEEPNQVELRASTIGKSIRDDQRVVIIGRGYATEEQATVAGEQWTASAMRSFAAQHLQADFGDRAAKSFFTKIALTEVSSSAGQPALNDIHGLMVYPSEPRPVLLGTGSITGIRGALGERVRATILHGHAIGVTIDPEYRLAYDLFSAAAIEGAPDARLMMLMMALETIISQEPRPQESIDHIMTLRDITADSTKLAAGEKHSLDRILQELVRESVGKAGRRLAKTLGKRRYMDESPVEFFNACYELRSTLAHGYLNRPGRDVVGIRAASLELFVADLLAGPLIGFGQDR